VTRTVLIVSPQFPPSTLAAVHRARHLAKHLPAAGWRPIVVCVDERFHEEALDPALAALVPASVEVDRAAALPIGLTRPLGVGDLGLRGYFGLRRQVFRRLAAEPIDAVLITAAPYYPLLLAPQIKRRFGTPVVVDLQDPWVSDWGAAQPRLSKAGISHALAAWLEPKALRGADFVTSVSATQNQQMAGRYPWLDAERMAAIPIGGDPDDFDALRAAPPADAAGDLAEGFINLSYVGTFLPRAGPLVRALFRSLAALRQADPSLAARIRLNFVGTSNQPNDTTSFRVRPIAEEEGVADLVREIPQRVPFLRALGVLARSQGLLLIGSDEPHYTASKIYPSLMSGRPFLSIFHRRSSAHAILSACGGGLTHGFEDLAELEAMTPALTESLQRLVDDPETLGHADPAAYAPYEAKAVAADFARIFDQVSRR
jgi:hypothetical protein